MHSAKDPQSPVDSTIPATAYQRIARQAVEPHFKGPILSGWYRQLMVGRLILQIAVQRLHTVLWSRAYDWVSRGRARAEEKDWITLGRLLQKQLGALKGPLMKFGQMASYVNDQFPASFRDLLSSLQIHSAALDPKQIKALVEKSLGASLETRFAEWTEQPLAAASIAQLHLARLHTGERVVVKVKYPGIEAALRSDLWLIERLVPWLSKRLGISNMKELTHEFGMMILGECDFRMEAAYQERFRQAFQYDREAVIPRVFPEYSTSDVLTMEYIEGQSFADFQANASQEEKNRAGKIIARVAAESIHRHCIYNGDPHPGNYLFLKEGRVAFLDFGFTRQWTPEFINLHKRYMLAAFENDLTAFIEVITQLGYATERKEIYPRFLESLRKGPVYPWLEDRPFRFTPDFIRGELAVVAEVYRHASPMRLPSTHLILQRVLWGQHALLADLKAEVNLHQVVVPVLRAPLTTQAGMSVMHKMTAPPAIKVRPIRNIFELWEVYRITHDCYVETGYIRPRPTGLLVHYAEFDHIPETMILVALRGDEIVGSISYTLDGPSGFIIEKDYWQESQKIRQEGRLSADVWRLVIKKEFRSDKQVLMALVTQVSQILIVPLGVKTWLLDVHERHEVAYKRLFNMVPVGRREGVPGLEQEHIAAVLLRYDVERTPKSWQEKLGISPTPTPLQQAAPARPMLPPAQEKAKQAGETYEKRIQPIRQRFNESLVAQTLGSNQLGDELLILFLINFCAYGVGMTRPVESWISRVGERCVAMGLDEQGHAFKQHALQKANHHLLLIADLRSLVTFWNERFQQPHLSAEKLLARPIPVGVLQYQKLHEDIIAGQEPFRQFAVEYEVDRLSLEYGAWLVSRCIQRFGKVFLSRISFFQKDVSLDVGRTQFNWLGLGKLLAGHPIFLDPLVETGTNALDSYQQFLADCVLDAEAILKKQSSR